MISQRRLTLATSIAVILLLLAIAWEARSFDPLAMYFPLVAAGLGLILAAINLVGELRAPVVPEEPEFRSAFAAGAASFGSIVVYVIAITLLGFFPASAAFLFLVLYLRTDFGPTISTALSIGSLVALYFFGDAMLVEFPEGLLTSGLMDRFTDQ